jgi:predicted small lipoprotein YifL
MKKLVSLLLVAAMVFALAACGDTTPAASNSPQPVPPAQRLA